MCAHYGCTTMTVLTMAWPVRPVYLLLTVAALTMQTKPVVDYYSKLGLYSPIDANQKADTVKAAIAAILK